MPKRFRVIIADFITDDLAPERRILGDLADIQAVNADHEARLAGHIEDAHAVMLYHCLSITRASIEKMGQCKLIVRCGVGYDNIDFAFARQCGINVANVPDYGTEEVADSTTGLMLALTRGFHRLNSRLQAGRGDWSYMQVAPIYRLRGRVFGIVGLGRDRKSTRLNSSHIQKSRMPSSA